MDNSRDQLQDYFNAARSQPGISEEEVRAIVQEESSRRAPALYYIRGRKWMLGAGGLLLALLIGSITMMVAPSGSEEPSGGQARTLSVPGSLQGSLQQSTTPPAPSAAVTNDGIEGGMAPGNVSARRSGQAETILTTSTQQRYTSNEREKETMITKASRRLLATSVAMIGAATAVLPAQTTDHLKRDGDRPAVIREMETELGTAVSDYWTSRLNDYKVRIDRVLSPADLEELNRLRVRFSVLAVEWLGNEMGERSGTREEREEGLKRLIEIYKSAKGIAGRYRTDLDGVGIAVVDDLAEFLPEMNQRTDNFMAAHRDEIDRTGYTKNLSKARTRTDEVAALLGSGQGRTAVRMLYTMTLEPVVMLYNGTDLGSLWRQVQQFSTNNTLSLPTDAIAGYKLPETTVLKPSAPNPASSVATIPYSLTEPSEQTLLRVYDAQGTLVASYDQGARPLGEHMVQVDVAGFPAGTYLYHLSVRTSKGDRVYSRTMQVVR